MLKRGLLQSVGKDNNTYNYEYLVSSYTHRHDKYTVIVLNVNRVDEPCYDWFDFQYVELSGNRIKTIAMFLDMNQCHRGKGLPEALILELRKLYPNHIITSSSNTVKDLSDECRTEMASSVWNRLVRSGQAIFDIDKDVFTLK